MKTSKTESVARGGKMRTDYARDDSSHDLSNTMGGKMGGSTTNLAHSLSGAGSVSDSTASKKNKFS